jgi:membrane fusion protein (multidrug efflux system)
VTGRIHQISARVAGTVQEVLVEDNQAVKAGDVLARLDPLGLDIALQKVKAALAQTRAQELQARAAMEQAKAEAAQSQALVAQAQARVEQTGAQLDVANVNAGRNQRLFQNDARAVSKSEVDTTRSTAQATGAALEGSKANVEAARAKVQASEAAAASAQAQLAAAQAATAVQEAAVRDAERELSYTTLTAPAEGRIGNKSVEVGNRVQVGQTLFALVSREVWIMANFKETQLKKMRAGQPVEITIDALEGRAFSGKVDSISPASGAQFALLPPDNATGNFTKVVQRVPVKIVFDLESIRGIEDRLRPGLSTTVSVRVK